MLFETAEGVDIQLGYYDYGFRFYDPSIGRFTGVDPIADQFAHVSVYNYAENSPIRYIDLWGLQRADPPMLLGQVAENMSKRDGSDMIENYRSLQFGHTGTSSIAKGTFSFSALSDSGSKTLGTDGIDAFEGSYEIKAINLDGYSESGGAAISLGGEASLLDGNVEAKFFGNTIGFGGKASGSVLKAEANVDAGLFTGQGGKTGFLIDLNIGAYTLDGEVEGGTSIFGIEIYQEGGATVGSAHAGLTIGAYYDKEESAIIIEGFQHVGLGIGEKGGGKISIPFKID